MAAPLILPTPASNAAPRKTPVLHLLHTMAYGGVETALINWLTHLSKDRFEPHLACFANPGGGGTEEPFVQAAEKKGLSVFRVSWGRHKPLVKASAQVADYIRRHNIEILHTHNCYADCVGALAARRVRVKTISTVYVWSNALGWKRGLIQSVNRQALRFFDLVTAHCEETYRASLELGIPPQRLKTLVCGYEVERVEMSTAERLALRRAMGIADDELLLANVARLYPEKAQDLLLRCFAKIAQQCSRARLAIAGVGPLDQSLKELCQALGLADKVKFVGFVHDLPRFLALVDIQVNSSWTEGVPLAICAGLAAGLPIVATRVGGLPEVVRHGRSGILVPPGDENALIESVLSLTHDDEQRRKLGLEARRFIEDEYSLAAAVRRLEQTYDEVLQ